MPAQDPRPLTNNRKRGFTLIELMIAISIIAILSAVGITTFSQSQKLGRDSRRKQDLRAISIALELFFQKNGRYPCSSNPAAWQNSSAGENWLEDKTATELAGVTCATSATKINPTYIGITPKDPNNSPNYYGYWQGSCSGVNTYALRAILENPTDKESIRNRVINWCGTGSPQLSDGAGASAASAAGWNLDTFLIASW